MKEIRRDYIFPSFVYSMDLENLNNLNIVEDAAHIKNNVETVTRTNFGGWQSPAICKNLKTHNLNFLESEVKKAVQFVLETERINNIELEYEYWININSENNYNVLHNHSNILISAVYYPFVPQDCAVNLVFVRTDGGSYFKLSENINFPVLCRTGMLVVFSPHLFHYVTANNSKQDRISIAFNFVERR